LCDNGSTELHDAHRNLTRSVVELIKRAMNPQPEGVKIDFVCRKREKMIKAEESVNLNLVTVNFTPTTDPEDIRFLLMVQALVRSLGRKCNLAGRL